MNKAQMYLEKLRELLVREPDLSATTITRGELEILFAAESLADLYCLWNTGPSDPDRDWDEDLAAAERRYRRLAGNFSGNSSENATGPVLRAPGRPRTIPDGE
jgi:hypothetical protein